MELGMINIPTVNDFQRIADEPDHSNHSEVLLDLELAWNDLAAKRENTCYDHALFIILKAGYENLGFDYKLIPVYDTETIDEALINLAQAFTPITRPSKLANGRIKYDTLFHTLEYLSYAENVLAVSEHLEFELSTIEVCNVVTLAQQLIEDSELI